MRVTLTKDFESWCKNDDHLLTCDLTREKFLSNFSPLFPKQLLKQGLGSKQILELMGSVLPVRSTGYGWFSELRYILWSWPNGDKILYPLNSSGEIYIGTDDHIWSQYWPFLSRDKDGHLICNLNVYSPELSNSSISQSGVWLGGQSHFGHFVVNFLAPLLENTLAIERIRESRRMYVPCGYSDLHRGLITRLMGVEDIVFNEVGGLNGVYSLRNVIIPALTDSIDAITRMQGILESRHSDRTLLSGKRVYLCRNKGGHSDRLSDSRNFAQRLKAVGFIICDPLSFSLEDRLSIIGNAEWILTESGSCSLNAYLFGNRNAVVKTLIPRSVFQSNVCTEINMLLPVLDAIAKGKYIPLETQMSSSINSFYDVCSPPSIERIIHGFESMAKQGNNSNECFYDQDI